MIYATKLRVLVNKSSMQTPLGLHQNLILVESAYPR